MAIFMGNSCIETCANPIIAIWSPAPRIYIEQIGLDCMCLMLSYCSKRDLMERIQLVSRSWQQILLTNREPWKQVLFQNNTPTRFAPIVSQYERNQKKAQNMNENKLCQLTHVTNPTLKILSNCVKTLQVIHACNITWLPGIVAFPEVTSLKLDTEADPLLLGTQLPRLSELAFNFQFLQLKYLNVEEERFHFLELIRHPVPFPQCTRLKLCMYGQQAKLAHYDIQKMFPNLLEFSCNYKFPVPLYPALQNCHKLMLKLKFVSGIEIANQLPIPQVGSLNLHYSHGNYIGHLLRVFPKLHRLVIYGSYSIHEVAQLLDIYEQHNLQGTLQIFLTNTHTVPSNICYTPKSLENLDIFVSSAEPLILHAISDTLTTNNKLKFAVFMQLDLPYHQTEKYATLIMHRTLCKNIFQNVPPTIIEFWKAKFDALHASSISEMETHLKPFMGNWLQTK